MNKYKIIVNNEYEVECIGERLLETIDFILRTNEIKNL